MNDAELITCALGTGRDPGLISERLLALGGLFGVYVAGPEALALLPVETERLQAIFDLAARVTAPPSLPARIEQPADVVSYLQPRLALRPAESFWVVMLDARGRPLGCEEVARGTLTACLVHPREVFAPAIRRRAASIIVVHNHPSGEVDPSPDDISLTVRLADAGALVGIPLVDHLIVGRSGYQSLGGASERVDDGARVASLASS